MPRKQLENGFVKANSTNLPKVDSFMVFDYLTKDDRFNSAETRNMKLQVSSRETYGDSAIGYVCLKRDNSICIVKADICPEHRVRQKDYLVSLTVDEKEERITELQCQDCAASLGGCKHAIAFLMWVHRRTEDPSPTETDCYWKKSLLSSIGSSIKYITASEMVKSVRLDPNTLPDNSNFLKLIIEEAQEKQLDSQLTRHNFQLCERSVYFLSMHNIMLQYIDEGNDSIEEFSKYAANILSRDLCEKLEKETREQSDSLLWFECRYGRITASKIYEAAQCNSPNGSLVNLIVGASKKFDNSFMARGRALEEKVIGVIEKRLGKTIKKCGLLLLPSFPMLGASPDGLGDDFVVEVKCPSTEKGFKRFLSDGKMNLKCKAQMMLQMLAANKQKGVFAIADPKFEKNLRVTLIEVHYDKNFLAAVIKRALKFWEQNIFPILLKSIRE